MIRAHWGLDASPFDREGLELLPHQQEILDTLRVHCQQGGLCLVVGEPGTGKSVLKEALCSHDVKRLIAPVANRTLHTYTNTLKLLCESFKIETNGRNVACEKRLIERAKHINGQGKMLAIIIDDAHLMDIACLRRLRLLLEDFPKNHNLILMAQPSLLNNLSLAVHEDIKSRITYSVLMPRLTPDDIEAFVLTQLDRVSLAHATFRSEALGLIARSSEGTLRATRNLCIGGLMQAVRDRSRVVDLKQINRVLLQPHWRKENDMPT